MDDVKGLEEEGGGNFRSNPHQLLCGFGVTPPLFTLYKYLPSFSLPPYMRRPHASKFALPDLGTSLILLTHLHPPGDSSPMSVPIQWPCV